MRYMAQLMAFAVASGLTGRTRFEENRPSEKPCRNCGKPTRHKKQFCSPNCCKESRDRAKREGRPG